MRKRNKPYFSIVIPTLNEEKYLPYLLNDLENQTFTDFEVIVVDGKSEDKTVEVANRHKKRLRDLKVLLSDERNVSYQRNMGAKLSSSDWTIFVDADNRLPKYFLDGIKYRIAQTKANIFTCWIDVDSKKTADKMIANYVNVSAEAMKILEYPRALGSIIGVKRDYFKKLGGFDEKLTFAEDGDFIRRAWRKGYALTIIKDPRPIYSLRRFRRMGRIGVVRKYAKLGLKRLSRMQINQLVEYPMGGMIERNEAEKYWLANGVKKKIMKTARKPEFRRDIKRLVNLIESEF